MSTKMLFALPFAVALLAGCASNNDTSSSSQSSLPCADQSGAGYLECQKNVTPTANTSTANTPSKMFRMLHPKPRNGDFGSMGSR